MRLILRGYTHFGWMIVSKHLRLNTVCPWLPLVAPSTLIICTLTFEEVTSLTHIMGKTAHAWVQLHTASVLGQLLATKVEILLVGFCPKIFGGNGDLNIIFLLKNAHSLSDGHNLRWWEHSNPTLGHF